MEKILIVDDERSILELLKTVFQKQGYRVETSLSARKALDMIEEDSFDLILTDIKIPGMSGMDLLKKVKEMNSDIPVIMITAYGTIKQAVEALKEGALDYVVKPFDVDELKIIVSQGLEKKRLKEENILLKKELREKYSFENMVGKSKEMQEIYSLIEKMATTDSTVLITGESGTGKELAARAIHFLSKRGKFPFVSINCGALPENLLESELFGHMKGSFTGAVANKKGMFEVAESGTLFLDEIGEMSPWTQVKLLRSLQEKKIRRVGGIEEIPVDARIMAASNKDLKDETEKGNFREDLYYRLNVLSLEMPPLRERKEDIPLLVPHFLKKYCEKMGRKMKRFSPEVIDIFESYSWPGNIRELANMIERIVAIEERETISKQSLPKELVQAKEDFEDDLSFQPGFDLHSALDDISREYIKKAAQASGGNLSEAATILGISYRSLRYLVEKLGLKPVRKNRKSEGRKEDQISARN